MLYNVAVVTVVFVGYFLGFSTANKDGELNDHCQIVHECRHFAYLCSSNRTCQCIHPYYRPNKYWDKCVGIVGQRCEYDEHCIDGAFCKEQKMCECKRELVPSEDNSECSLPVISDSTSNTPTKYTLIPVLILVYLKLFSID